MTDRARARKVFFHALPHALGTARLGHVCLVSFSSFCVFSGIWICSNVFLCFSFCVFLECGEAAGCGFSIQWLPSFNRPTHLVTIRSTIREPWKTQWIYGNRKKKIRIFYPIDDLAYRDCQYRLSFNCPTHLVNIRSTIREPWKTRMNIWQSFVVL